MPTGDRLGYQEYDIHYQGQSFLFLVDWFSAIPQPQETEGFSYGDLVLAHTWRYVDADSYLTLGLRQKSTPRSIEINSETVFNATSDATEEEYSLFFHFNYHGYDFGSFYSEDNELEAASFYMPLADIDKHLFSSTISYFKESPDAELEKRYEVSLEHEYAWSQYQLRSGLVGAFLPDVSEQDIGNVFVDLILSELSGMRFVAGLYYYKDIENNESLPGAKLGIGWSHGGSEDIQFNISIQQNALGDFHALVIRDEPVLSFTITGWLDELF